MAVFRRGLLLPVIFLTMLSPLALSRKLNFAIKTTWNGQCIKHEPMKVSLSPAEDGGCIMKVSGPFFNSPAAPQGPPGPFDKLWDYEVVEAFFLNDKDQYLEVELGPHGHHLLLMLNGQRNAVETKLPLTYTAEIYGDQWEGKASIPLSYFPPGVTKFNAYAIHGEGDNRIYESLYPAKNTPAPDFHRLEFFEPLDMTKIVYNYNPDEISEKWKPYEKS
ncbi:UPF0462 protein C4orf33 homolog isoform X2 [Aplysia californica]|uniref:UPF0462 protein C4orf33 homolog isoform X2 n=1 Tax=Aplysia californica TaxID=6500 RepID=A0ABM0JYH9_APLCA|nr:UPF0462 protein C4orf33 homolog isoform X2 [Aplysia californica]